MRHPLYFRFVGDWKSLSAIPIRIPVSLLLQREPRRQSCLKIDWFAGDGMMEFQKSGMQKISSIARQAGEIFERLAGQTVQRIAHQGMADGCQMDPDLMRAARTQSYLKCCGAWCAAWRP